MVVDVNCAIVEACQKPGFCGVEIDAFDVTVVVIGLFFITEVKTIAQIWIAVAKINLQFKF